MPEWLFNNHLQDVIAVPDGGFGRHNASIFDRLRSSRIFMAGALAINLLISPVISADTVEAAQPTVIEQQQDGETGAIVADTVREYFHDHAISDEPAHEHTKRTWIMNTRVLNSVTSDPAALAAIANDRIFAIGFDPHNVTDSEKELDIIPTYTSTKAGNIVNAILNKTLPKYIGAILYDNEPWALTPPYEYEHYKRIYKDLSELIHNDSHMLFIVPPVPSVRALKVAKYADVVDIQAQFAQSSANRYKNTIAWKARKVAEANPDAIILSGISTNPSAGVPDPRTLVLIVDKTNGKFVDGYWLNEPNGGGTKSCPHCYPLRADIGKKFLRLLGPAHLGQGREN